MFTDFKKKAMKGIKKVDIFAQPVQFLIKQEEGHKTLFGAGLTLGLIALFLYFLIVSLYNLSLRKDPSSYSTQVYHQSPEYYFYDQSNFTITFSIQNSDYATYIDESIYIVEATLAQKVTKMYVFDMINLRVDNKSVDEWTSQELPITTCTEDLLRQDDLKEYFTHVDLPTNYCIDWDKINKIPFQGTFDSTNYNYVLIQFKMCTETTKKSTECKSSEEIASALQNNYFSLQLSSQIIDIKDSKLPLKSIGQDTFTTTSSKIFKEISFYLEPITIFSDFGLINKDYQELRSLRYKYRTEMLDFNESDLIMNVVFRLDQTEQQYYINYTKIQSIFGELGGLWNIFFTVALLISKPIGQLSYYIRILNSLFQFEQPQKNHNQLDSQDHVELMSRRQFSSTREAIVQNKSKAFQRLQSIKMKANKLDSMEKNGILSECNLQTKQQLSKAISTSIKQYFQSISKKLKLKWMEYLYFIKCFKKTNDYKSIQIEYSVKKVIKQMDILYIMKKLQEIDKLKMILLTESQIKVFDYLQKPMIPADPSNTTFNQNQQYFSILKPIKSDYQRAVDAQAAFRELANNIEDPINQKLIHSIDETIVQLLKLRKQTDFGSMEEIDVVECEQEKQSVPCIDIKQKAYSLANIDQSKI